MKRRLPLVALLGLLALDGSALWADTPAPTIHFLDVQSVPVGSYLGIRGARFGAVAGSVSFGNVSATTIVSWADDRITVVVPAGAQTPVRVHSAAGSTSNPVGIAFHSGRTLWVSLTGNDSTSCSETTPCRTLERAKSLAVAGDVVVARGGRYCENSGSGAGLYLRSTNSGASGRPISYRSYPNETVTVDCCGVCGGSAVYVSASFIQIAGIGATGARGSGYVVNGSDVTVSNCRAYQNNMAGYASTSGSGINVQNSSHRARILGCDVWGNGSVDNLDHGMYLKGYDMEIAFNDVHDNTLGYGAQLYDSSATYTGAKVYSNRFFRNRNAGLTIHQGAFDAQVFNNEFFANQRNGLNVGGSTNAPRNAKIYNNTFVDNDSAAAGYYQVRFLSGSGTIFVGNIVSAANGKLMQKDSAATVQTSGYNQFGSDGPVAFSWNGSSSNLAGWRSASGQDSNSATGAPGFQNPATNDYSLLSGSSAVDSGSPALFSTLDRLGVSRPQGSGPDRGALERFVGSGSGGTPPAVVQNLRRIDRH